MFTFPRRRTWQPTPVFVLGESQGRRNLAGYSPQGRKSGTWYHHQNVYFSLMKRNHFSVSGFEGKRAYLSKPGPRWQERRAFVRGNNQSLRSHVCDVGPCLSHHLIFFPLLRPGFQVCWEVWSRSGCTSRVSVTVFPWSVRCELVVVGT